MIKIMLYGNRKLHIVSPVNMEQLVDAIDFAASGYGEATWLRGIVYDDSNFQSGRYDLDEDEYPMEDVYAYSHGLYESGNLLFTKGGDDALLYQEETNDYIDEDGNVYSSLEEAYKDWTHKDYGGGISGLFSVYEPYLKSYAAEKSSYYSDAARKETVDFVKARYEEKAGFWGKISRGEEVMKEEIGRCGPNHRPTKIDLFVMYRNNVETWAKGDTEFLREMNKLLPDVQKEMREIISAREKDQRENVLTESQQKGVSALRQMGNRVLPYEVGMGKEQPVEREEESYSY